MNILFLYCLRDKRTCRGLFLQFIFLVQTINSYCNCLIPLRRDYAAYGGDTLSHQEDNALDKDTQDGGATYSAKEEFAQLLTLAFLASNSKRQPRDDTGTAPEISDAAIYNIVDRSTVSDDLSSQNDSESIIPENRVAEQGINSSKNTSYTTVKRKNSTCIFAQNGDCDSKQRAFQWTRSQLSAYVYVIIMLSSLVLLAAIFLFFRLFMKAEAHVKTDIMGALLFDEKFPIQLTPDHSLHSSAE